MQYQAFSVSIQLHNYYVRNFKAGFKKIWHHHELPLMYTNSVTAHTPPPPLLQRGKNLRKLISSVQVFKSKLFTSRFPNHIDPLQGQLCLLEYVGNEHARENLNHT
jgi:hypothetical protein